MPEPQQHVSPDESPCRHGVPATKVCRICEDVDHEGLETEIEFTPQLKEEPHE
jgi:hypothetical protein